MATLAFLRRMGAVVRIVAVLASLALLAGCGGGEAPAPTETEVSSEPSPFPEELACKKFYELMATTLDEGDLTAQEREDLAVLADKAARELDLLTLSEPVDEDGNPSRVGELTHQSREVEGVEEAQEWAAEFRDACD